jgi:hypothetical protein
MADLAEVQGEDQSFTLTISSTPAFGTSVVWVMIDRGTKDAVITKDIDPKKITGTSTINVEVDLTAADTAPYVGAFYYELWGHGTTDELLDSGSVIITPTYGGGVTA